MKNFLILLLFLAIQLNVFPQAKYFIYFKDKGITKEHKLTKSSEVFKIAEEQLSTKARARRMKVLEEDEIVTYKDIPVSKEYLSVLHTNGIKIKRVLNWFNAVSCYLTDEQIQKLKKLDFIDKVEPVKKLRNKFPDNESQTFLHKNDGGDNILDYGNSLTQMELSQVPVVHEMGITGERVIIGFIDSGFNWEYHSSTNHLNVLWEYDFVNDDNDTGDDGNDDSPSQNVHGTQTVAVACGYEPGRIIGPAYDADVMFGKTEYIVNELNTEEDDFAAAVEEMEKRGVDILTSSLGYLIFDNGQFSYTHDDMDGQTAITTIAYETAAQMGVLTITSAGNEGTFGPNNPDGGITAPADGLLTIAVGNVNSANVVVSSSSRGPTADGRIKPEVVAMGSSVYSVGRNAGEYQYVSGTSYSAPIVAGIAGQIYSAFPHLNNLQVRQMLIESGDNPLLPNNTRGWGLVSALRAVTYPNLQSRGSSFRLYKIFHHERGINPGSVQVHYSVNNGDFISGVMENYLDNKFRFNFPHLTTGDNLQIYFSYANNDGEEIREPQDKNFTARYGELQMNLNNEVIIPDEIPNECMLSQNYPNPFNNSTEICFSIPRDEEIKLVIYNLLGEEVITLHDGVISAGTYFVNWNANDSKGNECNSGIYFILLQTSSGNLSRKMIYLK